MSHMVISIAALLAAIALFNMGFGLQATLLGVRAGLEAFPVAYIGVIMALYYVGFIVGSRLGPAMINRVGHIRAFTALAAIGSAAALSHAVFVDAYSWMALRLITGFCLSGLFVASESWLNHTTTNDSRGTMLSVYMVVTLGGTAAGQALLNAADPLNFQLFALVSVLLSLSLVPVALTTRPAPPISTHERLSLMTLFAQTPLAVASAFAVGILNGGLWGMGAVYAQDIGMTTFEISMFVLLAVVGGMVVQIPLGKLSDRVERRLVITAGYAAIVGATLGLVLLGDNVGPWHFVMVTAFGATALPMYAISVAHASDVLDPESFVGASAALVMAYGFGAVIGPLAGGGAMMVAGPSGLFVFLGVVALVMVGFALTRHRIGPEIADEDRGEFYPLPRTTAQVIDLDPRAETGEESPYDDEMGWAGTEVDMEAPSEPPEEPRPEESTPNQ